MASGYQSTLLSKPLCSRTAVPEAALLPQANVPRTAMTLRFSERNTSQLDPSRTESFISNAL